MKETDGAARVHQSVFDRLATITTAMALTIMLIIILFFALTVRPGFASPELNARLRAAHFVLVGPVLLLITAVVLVAHVMLRRLLLPLRALADGVMRLTRGELDVVIPSATRDEFGALTAAFNRMVAQVREMIGARDQLLVDVSHELRSPVTRLKVALELLPEDQLRARMAADVREMEAMITELLELERLRDGRAIRKERVDLRHLVDEVVASCGDRRPPVRVGSTAVPVMLDADPRMMTVVIRNLVENAVTYSLADSRPVDIVIADDGANVMLRVTDDGPGIPEGEMANVFEPFYRLDRSRSRRTGGYGLGLSICKRIVEAHGGTIAIEPAEGRGASFLVRLPRRSAVA